MRCLPFSSLLNCRFAFCWWSGWLYAILVAQPMEWMLVIAPELVDGSMADGQHVEISRKTPWVLGMFNEPLNSIPDRTHVIQFLIRRIVLTEILMSFSSSVGRVFMIGCSVSRVIFDNFAWVHIQLLVDKSPGLSGAWVELPWSNCHAALVKRYAPLQSCIRMRARDVLLLRTSSIHSGGVSTE
jgi:hypothetical protein